MPKRTQKERSEKTVEMVLEAAEKRFAESGYAAVSADALVQEVGLTRGALYHHFGSKQGLFDAVVERVQARVATAVESETAAESMVGSSVKSAAESAVESALWQNFLRGCFAWLDAVTDRAAQQILLIDAPAVLGWERWLELDAQYGSRLLREGVRELVEARVVEVSSQEALFHLLNGAMNQAALWVARSPQPERTLEEVKEMLKRVLEGLGKLNGV